MSSRLGARRQQGVVLIMSLIFLLLLSLASTALLNTVTSQNRLGVVHQQARSLFHSLHGRLEAASHDNTTLRTVTQTAQAGEPLDWPQRAEAGPDLQPSAPDDQMLSLSVELLRPGYDCLVTGYSSGSCLPMELRGEGKRAAGQADSFQALGLVVETINVSSGGDSRAGIFTGHRGEQTP
ncbi:hypothetical protein [Salinicola socius]|uniref:Type 4 fimbrial biogenesis protein PilX N-terminal domain-containing protein n=1 Tax=Salinicola socius TaxID=404433 RepID=A0A1Q8SRQ4_9GAMM|nr:hypothetical protein [Salinicola socius]OLO04120.1 hypothetical protein BTW07_10845 [Salinicola socius]